VLVLRFWPHECPNNPRTREHQVVAMGGLTPNAGAMRDSSLLKNGGGVMKRLLLIVGILLLAVTASNRALAGEPDIGGLPGPWDNGLPSAWIFGASCDPTINYNCPMTKTYIAAARQAAAANGTCDPYVDYKCLDAYLGQDVATRFFRYYQLEWGHATAPADPNAPPGRRPDSVWPATPQSSPPMPFTEWPYGGTINIGVTTPNSVDSPLMVALANTQFGKTLSDAHIQIYGWINPGANISSNSVKPAGNFPISYDYTPNTIQLDQAVLYIERLPDTTQNDHFDWGFRVSGLYGVDGRYTMAYGLFSNQLLNRNAVNIADLPMVYTDLYFPVMSGLNIRVGRFISIPDIEAQLAPNNYTYAHSLTYTFDNYTNTGVQATLALTKNWIVQMGTTIGSDTMPWNWGQKIGNPYVLSGSNAAGLGRFIPAARCSRIRERCRRLRWVCAGPAVTAMTTSTWSPTPSTVDSMATTTCNGSASRTTINSTTTGISHLKLGTFTSSARRTSTMPPRPRSSPITARRSVHSPCRSMRRTGHGASVPNCRAPSWQALR
jgi:hypothetical protein